MGVGSVVAGVFALWTLLLARHARALWALWREPVFRAPVAILESDDWGAGPLEQVPALQRLRDVLAEARNAHGEGIVMTVGVILETLDRDASRAAQRHVTVALDDARQAEILAELKEGAAAGQFALQLHGQAHYRADTLLAASARDPQVAAWCQEPGLGWTETLPSALQSAWVDATTLPSRALSDAAVAATAQAECDAWCRLFGAPATVAVPTTFVWTGAVERAWSAGGVRVIVTPGTRHEGRDGAGAPAPSTRDIRNGERGEGGVLYLVRDVYFEPVRGHPPARLADGVMARAALGRPALIEMHRFNFCGPLASATAFDTLRAALRELLARVPEVRFLSTAALADIVLHRDRRWIEDSFAKRLAVWSRRARELRPFARWARLTGFTLPLRLLQRLA